MSYYWPYNYWPVGISATEAVHYQCMEAAQSRIRLLGLSGLSDSNVLVKKLPLSRIIRNDSITLPCILLTPQRETMNPQEGTTNYDDVGYGVLCTIVASDDQEPTLAANLETYQLWRESIAKAFRNQRLPGVDTVVNAWVEPADQVVPSAWSEGYFVSALLLRFISRQTRGIS